MTLIARNAQISTIGGYTQELLQKMLDSQRFVAMSGLDKEARGFVPPVAVNGDDSLLRMVGNKGAFALRIDTKLLPSSVVAAEVAHRAEEIEETQGFRLGRKQRKELIEQVTDELLPKAFTRTTLIRAWADWDAGLLIVDAANAGKRDVVFDVLFNGAMKALDDDTSKSTAPIRLWQTNEDAAGCMTDWLATSEAPAGITLDDGALIEGDEGAKVRISKQSVSTDQVKSLLEMGGQVTELAITINDQISCVLTKNLGIKRMTHLDMTAHDEHTADLFEDQLRNAEIILNAGAVTTIMAAINAAMGGQKHAHARI